MTNAMRIPTILPMAKVDIVVPCYNYGRYLERCVQSVLQQSVGDVRVLIIDDNSSDDTYSIASQVTKSDPRRLAHFAQ